MMKLSEDIADYDIKLPADLSIKNFGSRGSYLRYALPEWTTRATQLEAENERLWEFHALALRYWMTVPRPTDKEMYSAIAALDAYREGKKDLENESVASNDSPEK